MRQPAAVVTDFDFDLQQLIDNMIETMRANDGVGLAAPQVGVSKSVFVAEFIPEKDSVLTGFPLTVVCNPKVVKNSSRQRAMVEGCLSVPGREILVKRPDKATVVGQDRYGKNITLEVEGVHARVLQHETDHLNATLIVDHLKEVRTVFIGTGTLGAPALQSLITDQQYDIVGVVTGDAKAHIRGEERETNAIFEIAHNLHLPIIRTEKIREGNIVQEIRKWKPEIIIMADFGQIIPPELLRLPKYGVINIHPSLLPRYRGPAPVQYTILNGDKLAGVSLMLASEELDAGDIISQVAVELSGGETSTILKDYLSDIGATLLLDSLPYYIAGELKPTMQNEKKATYTKMIKKDDGCVNANTSARDVERMIRAFHDWPKVYTIVKDKRVQILSAHMAEAAGLVIDVVKPEGKKEMSYEDFKRGYRTELTFRD